MIQPINNANRLPGIDESATNRQIRPELIEKLAAYKKTTGYGNKKVGRLIGSNETQVSRALSGKFEGDVSAFEAKLEDFFRAEPVRRQVVEGVFQTVFSRNIAAFIETVRRTADIALAYSPAGKGKTEGVKLYLAENPTAICIDLKRWHSGVQGIERLLFAEFDTRSWKRSMPRGEWLVKRLAGSGRVIIIDNAQRITRSAAEWLCDFNDDTKCPVVLVGNPDVLDKFSVSDQMFSRVGLQREIKGGEPRQDAERMVQLHWPEAEGQLGDLHVEVAKGPGHLRALRKQLLLAKDMADDFKTLEDAFRAAHTQLIRENRLTKK